MPKTYLCLNIKHSSTTAEISELIEKIDHRAYTVQAKQDRFQRISSWRRAVRLDFKDGGRKAYQWIKDTWTPPLTALANKHGEVSTDPAEMVSTLQKEWDDLFNLQTQPSWDAFHEEFARFLQSHPCEVPEFSASMIKAHIARVKKTRAVAADGWRMAEIKDLPLNLLSMVANLLGDLESTQKWPTSNTFAIVSCIPKAELSADQESSPQAIALRAFDMRPICNISPWSTIYSGLLGLRFKHMQAWRESWLPASMAGARPKRDILDISLELTLEIDAATVNQTNLVGISLDRAKLFDGLSHQICFPTLLSLGAPEKIISTENL